MFGGYMKRLAYSIAFCLLFLLPFAAADCATSVVQLPTSCTGGELGTEPFPSGGCRTLRCVMLEDSMEVLACDKPDSQAPQYFEMYNQEYIGNTSFEICIGSTCIGSGDGFARGPDFPICAGLDITNVLPAGTALTILDQHNQTFSFDTDTPVNATVEWLVDGVVVATGGRTYTFGPGAPGTYNVSLRISADGETFQRDWALTVIETAPFLIGVDETAPTSDVILTIDIADAIQNGNGEGNPIAVGLAALFRDIHSLDGQVTIAIWQGRVAIVDGGDGEFDPFIAYVASILESLDGAHGIDITYEVVPSGDIPNGDLRAYFNITPYCGDGVVDQPEEDCDGSAPDGWSCTGECELDKSSCMIEDHLSDGETRRYMLGGTTYFVQLFSIEGKNATFSINDEISNVLTPGDTFTTSNGANLSFVRVLEYYDSGMTVFCLDAYVNTTPPVCVPGAPGQVSLTGDAFKIGTGSDALELREPIGEVIDTITESELTGLTNGEITTSEGFTDYYQYLRLKDGNNLQNITVNFLNVSEGTLSDYLVIDTDTPFFEWELQFQQGLSSALGDAYDPGALSDLEDRTINIMGENFTFIHARIDSAERYFEATLAGGAIEDTLREGETRTYSIEGADYEVTLVYVSDPDPDAAPTVKFSVNGDLTPLLNEGDSATTAGGLRIGVRDVLVNAREGVASFFLGARMLQLYDPTPTVADDFDGGVELNGETLDAGLTVLGSFTDLDNSTYKISSIKYRAYARVPGDTLYVPSGYSVRELMTTPSALLSPTLDLIYEGLEEVESTDFEINARGDDRYDLRFTNLNGREYLVPFFSNRDGIAKFGDETDDLVLVEADNGAYNIGPGDYFIVSSNNDGDKRVTNVLRYEGYDTANQTLNIRDLTTGAANLIIEGSANSPGTGTLVVGGHLYAVNVSNVSVSEPLLAIDLNGNGVLSSATHVTITTWGGIEIDPALIASFVNSGGATQVVPLNLVNGDGRSFNAHGGAEYVPNSAVANMSAQVVARKFDTSDNGGETFAWSVRASQNNQVDEAFLDSTYRGPLHDPTNTVEGEKFEFTTYPDDDEYKVGLTDFGIVVIEYIPAGSNTPRELTLNIPKMQRLAQVFVVLGEYETAPSDCVPAAFCGDGIVNAGETCGSCPADAGACPATRSSGGGGGGGGYIPPKVNKTVTPPAVVPTPEPAPQETDASGEDNAVAAATVPTPADETAKDAPAEENLVTGAVLGPGKASWLAFSALCGILAAILGVYSWRRR